MDINNRLLITNIWIIFLTSKCKKWPILGHGMQEVIGSTPIFSTNDNQGFTKFCKAFFVSGNMRVTQIQNILY